QAGDFSYRDRPPFSTSGDVSPREVLEQLPDVPALHEGLAPYFEVLVPHLPSVRSRGESYTSVVAVFDRGVAPRKVQVRLNGRLLETYPILWRGAHVLNERAFAILGPHLDGDYFAWREVAVE